MRKTILLFFASLFLLPFAIPSNAEDPSRPGNISEGGTGRKWAFCVGVSNYRDPAIPALPSGARDAKGIAGALKEHGGFDRVLLLTDEAGEKDLREALAVIDRLDVIKEKSVAIRIEEL